ncbi:hypothetical protein N9A28_07175 [Sulfurimonas sp.]|nr:hypothetical protein [Sulfurimonas sp.]
MKKRSLLLTPILLFALSPFDTPKANTFNTSAYESKKSLENKKVVKNKKLTCRYVCDKKVYKEQRISEAVSFYKKDKNYTFISDKD